MAVLGLAQYLIDGGSWGPLELLEATGERWGAAGGLLGEPCSVLLGSAQQCSAVLGSAQQCSAVIGTAQQCSAVLGSARQCSAVLGSARQ